MNKVTFLFLGLFLSITNYAQILEIPDENFKNALVNTICVENTGDHIPDITADLNNDGEIQVSEAEAITSLIIDDSSIISLEGVKMFSNLQKLQFTNTQITELDISEMTSLVKLECYDNLSLTDINLEVLPNLTELYCHQNNLYTIDASQTAAEYVTFGYNPNLTHINMRNGVTTECVVIPDDEIDYTCAFFLALPSLETVCVDDDEVFETSAPQENVQFVTDCLVNIKKIEKNNIILYPNPVKSIININNKDNSKIIIYNTLGQIIRIIEVNNDELQSSIDVSDLNTGTYIIEMISEDTRTTKKFVKI